MDIPYCRPAGGLNVAMFWNIPDFCSKGGAIIAEAKLREIIRWQGKHG